jgi:hypothetical protein
MQKGTSLRSGARGSKARKELALFETKVKETHNRYVMVIQDFNKLELTRVLLFFLVVSMRV